MRPNQPKPNHSANPSISASASAEETSEEDVGLEMNEESSEYIIEVVNDENNQQSDIICLSTVDKELEIIENEINQIDCNRLQNGSQQGK